jgi:hypothetical protein
LAISVGHIDFDELTKCVVLRADEVLSCRTSERSKVKVETGTALQEARNTIAPGESQDIIWGRRDARGWLPGRLRRGTRGLS